MKYILTLIFSISLLACQSDKKQSSESSNLKFPNTDLYEPLESEASSESENYQVALDFLNSYIESINKLEILEFVKGSSLATEKFKTELENMVIFAWEVDPQVGLGFDPLFDAQDFPTEGFELSEFNPETGYVLVKGIDWDDFRVAMKVVIENGHVLVDGCGVVNIPEDKRAPR